MQPLVVMARKDTKILIFILTTLSYCITFGQKDTAKTVLKPIAEIEKAISIISKPEPQKSDTIDRITLCKRKSQEYHELKKKLEIRLDSAKLAITYLNENEKGPYFHYLVIKETKESYFDWNGCQSVRRSHDYVRLDIKFEKQEKFRINLDGTSGQTFYRED